MSYDTGSIFSERFKKNMPALVFELEISLYTHVGTDQ